MDSSFSSRRDRRVTLKTEASKLQDERLREVDLQIGNTNHLEKKNFTIEIELIVTLLFQCQFAPPQSFVEIVLTSIKR